MAIARWIALPIGPRRAVMLDEIITWITVVTARPWLTPRGSYSVGQRGSPGPTVRSAWSTAVTMGSTEPEAERRA